MDYRLDIPPDLVARLPSFAAEQARAVAERLAAETERWCWKAVARGPGWRVWRSEARYEVGAIKHDFMLVPPGGAHPSDGLLFGLKTS